MRQRKSSPTVFSPEWGIRFPIKIKIPMMGMQQTITKAGGLNIDAVCNMQAPIPPRHEQGCHQKREQTDLSSPSPKELNHRSRP